MGRVGGVLFFSFCSFLVQKEGDICEPEELGITKRDVEFGGD